MITDKVLIFFPKEININSGGPSGFLAHNLIDKPREVFIFSDDIFECKKFRITLLYRIERVFFRLKNKRLGNLYKRKFFLKKYFEYIKGGDYKYIFFHHVEDYGYIKDCLSNEQKIIFQPHSPELAHEEFRNFSNDSHMYDFIKDSEIELLNKADFIILPNEHCIPLYKEHLNKMMNFKFIISGAKNNNLSECKKINLPQDKINLLYIGRRNNIKGFDIVLDTYRKVRKIRKDLNLILVGSGDKINEDGIIDVGFSSDPASWYNSVDYVINANRQSYFDLSIIEAISTGVPIIMSANFGHNYYIGKSSLIKTYDINESMELYNILAGKLTKRDYSNLENIAFYRKNLSDIKYYERLSETLKNIINVF